MKKGYIYLMVFLGFTALAFLSSCSKSVDNTDVQPIHESSWDESNINMELQCMSDSTFWAITEG